jgi:hypothetical protein
MKHESMSVSKQVLYDKNDELPRPGEYVMIQCPGFRCLAYRDRKGTWHDAYHQQEISKVLKVYKD